MRLINRADASIEAHVSSTKVKILVLAAAFGVGVAGLIYRCDESLAKRSGAHGAGEVSPLGSPELKNPAPPKRIAVMSSAVTELLFAMGAEDRIVGVTRFAVHPKAVEKIPKIGGLMDVNFERLASLEPDLIVAQSADPKIEAFSRRRGISFWHAEIERIGDVFHFLERLGARLGMRESARALDRRLRGDLDTVRRRVAGRPKVRCFLSVDRTPGRLSQLLSAGGGTFLSELLALAGGGNVFEDMGERYQSVSKEALIARAPEMIIELKPGGKVDSPAAAQLVDDWKTLGSLPALVNQQVHVITHDAALLPGPRMAEVAQVLAATLHPEVFGDDAHDAP